MIEQPDFRACESFAAFEATIKSTTGGSVGGWFTNVEREYLFQLARTLEPHQRFMEIGVYGGTTLSMMAILSDAEIIGMDSWENDTPNISQRTGVPVDLRTFCVENLERNGVKDRVVLHDGSSHGWGQSWATPLDVLIVDGDHTYGGALQDLRDFAPWVRELLIVDDYWSITEVAHATEVWFAEQGVAWAREWGFDAPGNQEWKMVAFRRVG